MTDEEDKLAQLSG